MMAKKTPDRYPSVFKENGVLSYYSEVGYYLKVYSNHDGNNDDPYVGLHVNLCDQMSTDSKDPLNNKKQRLTIHAFGTEAVMLPDLLRELADRIARGIELVKSENGVIERGYSLERYARNEDPKGPAVKLIGKK
jgi:hypothetical protein